LGRKSIILPPASNEKPASGGATMKTPGEDSLATASNRTLMSPRWEKIIKKPT